MKKRFMNYVLLSSLMALVITGCGNNSNTSKIDENISTKNESGSNIEIQESSIIESTSDDEPITPGSRYEIIYKQGLENYLAGDNPEFGKPGTTIKIKTEILYDIDLVLYAYLENGLDYFNETLHSIDEDGYWIYQFTMPGCPVTIDYELVGGMEIATNTAIINLDQINLPKGSHLKDDSVKNTVLAKFNEEKELVKTLEADGATFNPCGETTSISIGTGSVEGYMNLTFNYSIVSIELLISQYYSSYTNTWDYDTPTLVYNYDESSLFVNDIDISPDLISQGNPDYVRKTISFDSPTNIISICNDGAGKRTFVHQIIVEYLEV